MTHTFAVLELSPAAYDEIAHKMREAGYGHVFMDDGAIDMHGIGVTRSMYGKHEPVPLRREGIGMHDPIPNDILEHGLHGDLDVREPGSDIPAILRSTGLETLDPASGHGLMQIERLIKLSVPKLALKSHWTDYNRSLVISRGDERWTVYQARRDINHQPEIRGNVAGIIECLRRIEAERFPE